MKVYPINEADNKIMKRFKCENLFNLIWQIEIIHSGAFAWNVRIPLAFNFSFGAWAFLATFAFDKIHASERKKFLNVFKPDFYRNIHFNAFLMVFVSKPPHLPHQINVFLDWLQKLKNFSGIFVHQRRNGKFFKSQLPF